MTALTFPVSRSLPLTSRVNARLDRKAAERLQYLMTITGLAMSEVVRMSLDHLYSETRKEVGVEKDAFQAMIGRFGSGAKMKGRLSTDYKDLYHDGLAKKHGRV